MGRIEHDEAVDLEHPFPGHTAIRGADGVEGQVGNKRWYLHPMEHIEGDDAVDDVHPCPGHAAIHEQRQQQPPEDNETTVERPRSGRAEPVGIFVDACKRPTGCHSQTIFINDECLQDASAQSAIKFSEAYYVQCRLKKWGTRSG